MLLEVSDWLDCILKPQNLNCFKTFYFKVFDLYNKYHTCVLKTRWLHFILNFFERSCPWTSLPAKILDRTFRLVLFYIGYTPIYHALMLPFYILSIPFEFFLFQDNFVIKNFIYFWTIPPSLYSICYLCYFELALACLTFGDMCIKPVEIKWAVPYLIEKKYKKKYMDTSDQIRDAVLTFLIVFCLGFIYTVPFLPFLMI
jgi:hypothetical protein